MRELLIYEQELDHVGLLNTLAAGFFSAASGCFLFVVGLIADAQMQGELSDRAEGLLYLGIPAGLLLSVGFALAGCWAWKSKGSIIGEMKKQAEDIEQLPPAPVIAAPEEFIPSAPGTEEPEPPQAS